jgi:pheromone shutdown protein TraB
MDNVTGQQITLIGTAHLSETSNQQVRSIIAEVQPDVILVELDPSRLERIGIDDIQQHFLGSSMQIITVEDIQPPPPPLVSLLPEDVQQQQPWWQPLENICLDIFTKIARNFLTNMYKDMGDSMGGLQGGGEFLVAINAAKANDSKCQRLILGDRDSLLTIRRAAELALRTGNPLQVLKRLNDISQEELGQLEQEVVRVAEQAAAEQAAAAREKEGVSSSGSNSGSGSSGVLSQGEINVAVIEALKSNPDTRQRLFERLETEVPEFARAFLTERDYIMAEAIRRECCCSSSSSSHPPQGPASHVVAVVGVAHVSGMAKMLQESWKRS